MRFLYSVLFRLVLLGVLVVAANGTGAVELRRGNATEPTTLDPHVAAIPADFHVLGDMFLGLITEDAAGQPSPGAATEWYASDDGKIYTFTLRAGHKWSDGVPVTAEDFVFSFRRALAPETGAVFASLLYPIRNARAVNMGEVPLERLGVRAIDSATLEITLHRPAPYLLELLMTAVAYAVPRHLVSSLGADWAWPENLASNGAYLIDEWRPQVHVKLRKNPAFHDAGRVRVDAVYFPPNEDVDSAIWQFRAGEIDTNWTNFPAEQLANLRETMPDAVRAAPWLSLRYYALNLRRPPFDDRRVRRALSIAIDREVITKKVLRLGDIPASGIVPKGVANYSGAAAPFMELGMEDRRALAQRLLLEAGFNEGQPLELTIRYNTGVNAKKLAVAVAAMWKKIGVRTLLFNSQTKVHYAEVRQGDFEVAHLGWVAMYNDAESFLYILRASSSEANYGGYTSAEYDRLMDLASQTVGIEERARLMAEAEAVALADQPIIPLYVTVSGNLVGAHVKGWVDNIRDVHRTRYLWVER